MYIEHYMENMLTTVRFWMLICTLAFGVITPLPIFPQNALTDRLEQLVQPNEHIAEDTASAKDAVQTLPALEHSMRKMQVYDAELREIQRIIRKKSELYLLDELLSETDSMAAKMSDRLNNSSDMINLKYNKALLNYIDVFAGKLKNAAAGLNSYSHKLGASRVQLDSIQADPIIRSTQQNPPFPKEQLVILKELRTRIAEVDKELDQRRIEVATYQSRTTRLNAAIEEFQEALQLQRRGMQRGLLKREGPFIWSSGSAYDSTTAMEDVAAQTLKVNLLILKRYTEEYRLLHLLIGVLALLVYLWFRRMVNHIKKNRQQADAIIARAWYIPRYLFASAVLVILAFAPFLYPKPPSVLLSLLLFVQVAVTGIVLRGRVSSSVYKVWLLIFLIFAISTFSNLYWQVVYSERWVLLLLSVFAIVLSLWVLRRFKQGHHRMPPYIPAIAYLYLGTQALAFLCLALGRFNLGKILSLSATLGLQHAISLFVLVVILKEAVYLQVESSRRKDHLLTSYFDFEALQTRLGKFFLVVSTLIWAYFFLENLAAYDLVIDTVGKFMSQPRRLLNAEFNFGDILIFIGVLYVSVVLASNVAFFLDIQDQRYADDRNKRLGSFTLLVKIGIISTGFIIAVGISGIPIDKLAIVLGALSVGIGFGLQSIVNNLVSGIILAFERPIQIGDSVSIGPIDGIVQSIGVRASKIKNWDGAEVIIPNGDLLSQALTNWTLSDKQRRVELIIGVAYGSDIDLVTKLLLESLHHKDVVEGRGQVLLQKFNDNSIDFRVLFWVTSFDSWLAMRDAVMRSIAKAFKENNVQIPFPQRDLYIKEFPAVKHEQVSPAPVRPERGNKNSEHP